MLKAKSADKKLAIDILANAFSDNKSVNYIVRQDRKKQERIRHLMDYSFELCYLFGDVFFNDEKTAVALVLYPDQKRVTLKSVALDLSLVAKCIGLGRAAKALKRESRIKANYPDDKEIYYLWFIGVSAENQGRGIGSRLMHELLEHGARLGRPIYLETSTERNVPWYKRFGLKIYQELDFGYPLFMMRKINQGD